MFMNIPGIFKYFSLISIPLFAFIALLLIKNEPDFSFSKHTISKSAYFLKDPVKMLIFRFNFIIKAVLDLGFVFYLIFNLNISFQSPLTFLLILPVLLFGSLAYFIMGKHTNVHRIIIFCYGILFGLAGIWLAQMTGNANFVVLTTTLVIILNSLTIGLFFAKKINVFIQGLCIFLLYGWLVVYIFWFL